MMITYAHPGDLTTRFRQYEGDSLPHWAVDVQAEFPLVEQQITNLQAASWGEGWQAQTTDAIIEAIRTEYDRLGPYQYAIKYDLLIHGSGEEFAIQFMSVYNSIKPGTY